MKDIFSFPKCRMTHLSLFTGIGGLDLAAEWAGFETVGQCEWADYPTKVLEKHWPNVPRWRDIRELTGGSFFERTGCGTVDLISGGFPCQPFSFAGKRRGSGDDRYLWPEMLRVIKELRPRWVIGENVAGIVNMALDTVLSDLESIGYTTGAFIIPACAVDAPHRRDRCAIVANNDSERRDKFQYAGISEKSGQLVIELCCGHVGVWPVLQNPVHIAIDGNRCIFLHPDVPGLGCGNPPGEPDCGRAFLPNILQRPRGRRLLKKEAFTCSSKPCTRRSPTRRKPL